MQPRSHKYLEDIREAADIIHRITRAITLEQLLQNDTTRLAVERLFEILGEAISQLYRSNPSMAERITQYRQIIGLRNILIHGYSQVDYDALWTIIQTDIRPLQREVHQLLDEAEKV